MTGTPEGMTYSAYLQLDTLLSTQRPLSGLHDEMLFIVMHQTMELWIKQSLHELGLACAQVRGDEFAPAYKSLARLGRIQAVMTLSWEVLATLTPVDYSAFRDVLGTSSGFQSAQFRELEFRLGIKDPKYLDYHEGGSSGHARLVAALAEPSLWDEANSALARAGFDIGAKDQEGGPSDAIAAAWTIVYRDSDRWFELYQLAEKLVDVDEALASWRHKHVLTITRIIGNKMGTGGTAGAKYLESTLSKRAFPELWSLRTNL